MDYMFYIWLGILVLTLILEAATAGLTTIWFSGGALVALIMSFFGLPVWLQVTAFLVISIALLIFVRPLLSEQLALRVEKTNVDAIPGSIGVVTEDIVPIEGKGQVKVKGLDWSACSEHDDFVIPAGTPVIVVRVEGVRLIVRPRN